MRRSSVDIANKKADKKTNAIADVSIPDKSLL